jgi:hypothetical protein
MNFAPIALFAFNRPHHLKRTIEALAANDSAKSSSLFIFSDAAKNTADAQLVIEVRNYIKSVKGFLKVNIIEREHNLGLAESISSGVTMLMKDYGQAIILEDDILTSRNFLSYMNSALELYRNNEKVMHISAYIPPIETTGLPDSFFLRQSSCWGWASWDRAWVNFSRDGQKYLTGFNQKQIHDFNLNGSYDYWAQLVANEEKKLKTWAVYWYACVYSNKGLCLHPRESLAQNIGFDGSGQNCSDSALPFRSSHIEVNHFPLLPGDFKENELAAARFQGFIKSMSNTKKISIPKKIISKLRNQIKRFTT